MQYISKKSPSQPSLMPPAGRQQWYRLTIYLGYRTTIWVLENEVIYKFLGGVISGALSWEICIQGHPHGILFWRLHVPTICLLCCFIMVYVPAICLWCCRLLCFGNMCYKFCVVIYLSAKMYFIERWGEFTF